MTIGKPAWIVVSVATAGALGCAWRNEWRDCIILGVVAFAFAIASAFAVREAHYRDYLRRKRKP